MLSSLTLRGKNSATTSHVNTIDALQERTASILVQPSDSHMSAPGAKRAASTGTIGVAGPSSRDISHSPSPTTWAKDMPIPPPPPGPPPASARSQSLNRPSEVASNSLAPSFPSRVRRPPGHGTSLDTVPPTPADWRDDDNASSNNTPRNRSKGPVPLHIDTGHILDKRRSVFDEHTTTAPGTPGSTRRDSSTGALFRSPAVRSRSAKGIRERRSESRSGNGRAAEDSAVEKPSGNIPWDEVVRDVKPTDLVLPQRTAGTFNHRANAKITPRSGKSIQSLDGAMKIAEQRLSNGKAVSFEASTGVHHLASASTKHASTSSQTTASYPPHEIGSRMPSSLSPNSSSPRPSGPSHALSLDIPPRLDQRPVSHILHMPNSDSPMQTPLTPSSKTSLRPLSDLLGPESPQAFADRAIERHRNFAEREAAASDDSERLDLFVQFMLAESRIRREQYAAVFEEEDVDISDLVQGIFEKFPMKKSQSDAKRLPPKTVPSKRTSIASSTQADSSSQDESSSVSRKLESPSSATTNSSAQNRESAWLNDYIPSLSPIASMSIVTGQDEMDSRGRAPSRWWEDHSHSAEATDDVFNVLGRSKRESKYMGVPREARMAPILYEDNVSGSPANLGGHAAKPSRPPAHDPNEYPHEKGGWQEEASSSVVSSQYPPTPASAPYTPDPRRLDVSRFITLPPPYPRHHPAVSNSHPDLADTRAVVRSLHEEEKIESIRQTYQSEVRHKRERADSWCTHQRSLHQQDIEFRIEHGHLTPHEFEEADAQLQDKVNKSERDFAQDSFDHFQDLVVSPLHALFSERISLATSSLETLSGRLFSDAQSHSPNMPQEEGDEQPELLEKLTQLKWLFEARETLHRQIYDLLSERNEKYKIIILLPYQQSHNSEKQSDAETFFAQDVRDRRTRYEHAVSERTQAFLTVIDINVSRGVEMQLSAFWDISPTLHELLNKIPRNLEGFEIDIPPDEYAENPSYYHHPLQYLYSLLGHAEKSTFQFIESQINLLCLLNEIQSCGLTARCRSDANMGLRPDSEAFQRHEEKRLSRDLKEKVGVIEGQWEEALGSELMEIRERVRGALLEQGGWNDDDDV